MGVNRQPNRRTGEEPRAQQEESAYCQQKQATTVVKIHTFRLSEPIFWQCLNSVPCSVPQCRVWHETSGNRTQMPQNKGREGVTVCATQCAVPEIRPDFTFNSLIPHTPLNFNAMETVKLTENRVNGTQTLSAESQSVLTETQSIKLPLWGDSLPVPLPPLPVGVCRLLGACTSLFLTRSVLLSTDTGGWHCSARCCGDFSPRNELRRQPPAVRYFNARRCSVWGQCAAKGALTAFRALICVIGCSACMLQQPCRQWWCRSG